MKIATVKPSQCPLISVDPSTTEGIILKKDILSKSTQHVADSLTLGRSTTLNDPQQIALSTSSEETPTDLSPRQKTNRLISAHVEPARRSK
jgi:hypothetical protein